MLLIAQCQAIDARNSLLPSKVLGEKSPTLTVQPTYVSDCQQAKALTAEAHTTAELPLEETIDYFSAQGAIDRYNMLMRQRWSLNG
jgi:hypothetical protein